MTFIHFLPDFVQKSKDRTEFPKWFKDLETSYPAPIPHIFVQEFGTTIDTIEIGSPSRDPVVIKKEKGKGEEKLT